MGGAPAGAAARGLVQCRVVQQPYLQRRCPGGGRVEPAVLCQFLPRIVVPVQAHAAQQAGGQLGAAVGVGAQGALQGQQPGGGRGDAAECGGEVGEHFPYPLRLVSVHPRPDEG